jgi:hypothetical protein
MPLGSGCQECGQRLQNTYFCRRCGDGFCSVACLERHLARHQDKPAPEPPAPPGRQPAPEQPPPEQKAASS